MIQTIILIACSMLFGALVPYFIKLVKKEFKKKENSK